MPPEVQSLLSMGIGGAVLVFVVRPLMGFLFTEVREQREKFMSFLQTHTQHEEEMMREIRDILLDLKGTLTHR